MTIEDIFNEVGTSIAGAYASQLFGKPCFKLPNKKAFCCLFEDCMVFKLTGDIHKQALGLEGATLFDPSHKGRPMKEWVQVPSMHQRQYVALAKAAAEYVGG